MPISYSRSVSYFLEEQKLDYSGVWDIMNYYVYIIKSLMDDTYYKGVTTDYHKRLGEHNSGLSNYTSRKMPWKIIYVELHQSKQSALMRERKLKKCKSDYFEWLCYQPSNILLSS